MDNIISAAIPDRHSSPKLYELVKRYMVHGPCGRMNPKSPCMKDNKCRKYFSKKFVNETIIDEDGYPTYIRRYDGRTIEVRGHHLDNRFVVPYNLALLLNIEAHINIEKCNQSTAIKLSFHLSNQQNVIYSNTDDVAELLDKPKVCESMFLAWMKKNEEDDFAKTRSEFPLHYVYQRSKRLWKHRKKRFAVGRIIHAPSSSGELYYLPILLTKVKGPSSFEDIGTVDGIIYPTFRYACFALGLLDNDNEYISAIKEASNWTLGRLLRKMFVSMLLCSYLSRLDFVWKEISGILLEDLLYTSQIDHLSSSVETLDFKRKQDALKEIELSLQENGKSFQDFPSLPTPLSCPIIDVSNYLILQELSYETVLPSLTSSTGAFFFVNGYGGTGETFLWNGLTSTLHAKGNSVLTVASSGIAATLLPSGSTSHSKFAIPIYVNEESVQYQEKFSISKFNSMHKVNYIG
ncbi:uncharacterized protein LOC114742362 [Neltuma alba]|uniref:uncharacterized protein LOC114742362 n=1 Tax=Neltuma alba TaxID=207710 RepID=UPI0010A44891|nr:uncharacterized protein LOC114742362 [Prosopis alba]